MFLGGWMVRRIGPRFTTLIGGWTMSLGVFLSYFTIKLSFWVFLLTYGLMFGIGVGIAYTGPLRAAMKWLPKRKGLANGIVVAGFGLGALIFDAVQTTYVNPSNKKAESNENGDKYFTSPDLISHVPTMFLILGGSYAVMQLIGSLLITDPPEDYGEQDSNDTAPNILQSGQYREVDDNSCVINNTKITSRNENGAKHPHKSPERSPPPAYSSSSDLSDKPRGPQLNGFADNPESHDDSEDEKVVLLKKNGTHSPTYSSSGGGSPERRLDPEASINSTASGSERNVLTSLKPLQMLKKPNFYLLWVMFTSNGLAVLFIATLYKFFGLQVVNDDHYLASVGSVSAIFNFLGRIVWGIIADRVSYKFALVLLSGIMTVFLLTFYSCVAGGKIMYFFWVCVIFFCVGGNFSLFPTAIARAFGLQYFSENYGLLFTSQTVAGSMGAFLATVLMKEIGFSGLFFIVSGCTGLALLLAIVYRPKRYISFSQLFN